MRRRLRAWSTRWSQSEAGRAARRGPETCAAAPTAVASRRLQWGSEMAGRRRDPPERLSDVLKIFARLESYCPARRYADFFSGPGVSADAAFAGLDLEDAETAELDALAPLH